MGYYELVRIIKMSQSDTSSFVAVFEKNMSH